MPTKRDAYDAMSHDLAVAAMDEPTSPADQKWARQQVAAHAEPLAALRRQAIAAAPRARARPLPIPDAVQRLARPELMVRIANAPALHFSQKLETLSDDDLRRILVEAEAEPEAESDQTEPARLDPDRDD
ncbi:MAG TPA: hypothetical protein VGM88_12245 [Kofleriaceae bacterium]